MAGLAGRLSSAVIANLSLLIVIVFAILGVRSASVPCEDALDSNAQGWQPRTPEQTLYAYVRCLNDSTASVEMKIRWVRWEPDASPESQCYVKCVSEELRLYSRKEKRFFPERFVQQSNAFFNGDQATLEKFHADAETMLSGTLEEDTCESVFFKYAMFYTAHTGTILRMFHGDYRDIGNTYRTLGDQVKQIGQTYVDYCEKLHKTSWNEDQVKCNSHALVDCVFRGFRWITEEDEVNVNEIRRDYSAAGYKDEEENAALCHSSASNARELYNCLRDKDAKRLSKVITERNQRTALYFDTTSQDEPWKSAVEFANNLS